jgi:shikimate dehydrogenase
MEEPKESRFGLVGGALSHSYSKIIHEAFGAYGYELLPMPPEALAPFFQRADFQGVNVTIPYKKDVMSLCARLSSSAVRIGSVNTVVRQPDGSLHGYNTDYEGFSSMARRAEIGFKGRKVVILGSGGTSLTAQAVAADEGAGRIVVVSRAGENNYGNIGAHADCDVLINTTPVGMYPRSGESPVSIGAFANLRGVIDVIYNPLRTRLVLEAKQKGIPHTGGLFMLVSQAREAYALLRAESCPSKGSGGLPGTDALCDQHRARGHAGQRENPILGGCSPAGWGVN